MNGKLKSKVRELEAQVVALQPAPAPGILTSHTTRGVTRKANSLASGHRGSAKYNVPRWG